MLCPHCGFEDVPSGARFCPNCGRTLPQTTKVAAHIQATQEVGSVEGGTVTGVRIGQVIGTVIVHADEESHARRRRNLRILLEKVKAFWIVGVLERSAAGAGLIELGKQAQPDAVEHPWETVMADAEPAAHALPPGKTIADTFEDMDHAMLILDGVGSGKTITLLELARDTLERAEQDPLQPVPVVLNLSSWTQPGQSIANWVVDELTAKYQIPARLGRQWLEDNDLALLLDGLDEVEAVQRASCLAALNQFRQDYGLVQIGICSRTQAYEAAGIQLKLTGAILLQPLTMEQIEQYLAAADPGAKALRAVLREDEDLQAMARSPLMLSMMRLAYQDVPFEALQGEQLDTSEERRVLLLDHYVERMFQSVVGTPAEHYPRAESCRWLAWLASGMLHRHQSLFLIERLQPSWLPGRLQRWLYILLTRLIAGIVLGLSSVAWGFLLPDLQSLAWGYLLVGAMGGLAMGLVDGLCFELGHQDRAPSPAPGRSVRRLVMNLFVVVLIAGLVSAAIYWLRWTWGLIFGLKEGLMFGLAFGLIFGFRNRVGGFAQDMRTVEALAWSPMGSFRGVLAGLGTGLLMGLAFGLVAGLVLGWSAWSQSTLVFVSIFGPTLALIGAVLGGLQGILVETKTLPNQGIWLSARNALLVGLAVGLAGGLGEGLINVLIGQIFGVASAGLGTVLIAGLFWGIIAALWYGALDLIKHFALRVMLALAGCTPWNYARFLDYAADRAFLQKVGGGYVFANRLLQEYFANVHIAPPSK